MNKSQKAADYKTINREAWNVRTDVHFKSDFYDLEGFLNGKSSLNSIELDLLGDLKGKKILHLQCHFGQDSISLARMGAEVTGIDISDSSIAKANQLAAQTGVNCKFIRSDIYDLPDVLEESFDMVFTSYGTIGWLPDIDRWASVIDHFLKPGGKLIFVEFHPVVWIFDDSFLNIDYPYFNSGPIVENYEGTYTNQDSEIKYESVSWNHGLGEVLGSLRKVNFRIDDFQEYDYSPYDCFQDTIEPEPGVFRIRHLDRMIPMVYSIRAIKP